MDTVTTFTTLVSPYEAINTVVGALLPLLVALITNKFAHPQVKAALLLLLSLIQATIATALASVPEGLGWSAFLSAFGTAFTAAVVAHFGIWKKGLGDWLAKATANVGVGGKVQGSNSDAQPAPGVRRDQQS